MAPRKKYYGTTEEYERKLDRVMKRFEVSDYRYDWNRDGSRFYLGAYLSYSP